MGSFTIEAHNALYQVQLINLREVDGIAEFQVLFQCRTLTVRRIAKDKWAPKAGAMPLLDEIVQAIGQSLAKYYYA